MNMLRIGRLPKIRIATLSSIVVFVLCFPLIAQSQPDFSDIGTHLVDPYQMGLDEEIHTRIDLVTWDEPTRVTSGAMTYNQVTGDIHGIGWGGWALISRTPRFDQKSRFGLQEHFEYKAPFVLFWPDDWNGRMIVYIHGGAHLTYDFLWHAGLEHGPETSKRDPDIILERGYAYFKIDGTGYDRQGQVASWYLRPEDDAVLGRVVPMSLMEAAVVPAQLGLTEGDRVPLSFNASATVNRDTIQVAERLLGHLTGTPVSHKYGLGSSVGGAALVNLLGGREELSARCPQVGCGDLDVLPRTGGNYLQPYVPASGLILDGAVIANVHQMRVWFTITPGNRVDPEFPATAPILFIQGQADPWYLAAVKVLGSMAEGGANLEQNTRLYHVRNLPHVPRTGSGEAGNDQHCDRSFPVIYKAVDNLHAWVSEGTAPPMSWIDGRLGDGGDNPDRLFFELADGSLTDVVPFVDDPRVDSIRAWIDDPAWDHAHEVTAAELAAWQAVTSALSHEPRAIELPSVRCRVGGMNLEWFAASLVPFDDCTLNDLFGDYETYQACVSAGIEEWSQAGFYDEVLGQNALAEAYVEDLFDFVPGDLECNQPDGGPSDGGLDGGGGSGCGCAMGGDHPIGTVGGLILSCLLIARRRIRSTAACRTS